MSGNGAIVLIHERHSVRRGDRELVLAPRKFAIFARIFNAGGITSRRLFDAEYPLDVGGGPESGHHIIVVQIAQMNRHLAAIGLRIVMRKRRVGYEIEQEAMP